MIEIKTTKPDIAAVADTYIKRKNDSDRVIALAGNPNVGKSTLFNALTGLNQHTGNWPGKTVGVAQGVHRAGGRNYILVDLPGTYSIIPSSAEEAVARDFITGDDADAVVVVCDATCLERSLILALTVAQTVPNAMICVNLMDEAARKGIEIDIPALERLSGLPAAGISARSHTGLRELVERIGMICNKTVEGHTQTGNGIIDIAAIIARAQAVTAACVRTSCANVNLRDRRLDRILMGKYTGLPVMLILLCAVFWITLSGANAPSALLSSGLFWLQDRLTDLFVWLNAPAWLHGVLVMGLYRVLAWVVSVMLPPMAIFFPLFTLLEDFGYLPRVAFNLDRHFKKAGTCGKQGLTMCLGFGCNAAGVVGCRIIDSPRERLIGILTNNFVPCNGRFPTLIALITMFFIGVGAGGIWSSLLATVILTGVIVLGIIITFAVSRLLSDTLLRGQPSSFTLELPPYRAPQAGRVVVRSIFDRTIFVLGRAVCVAAPAGILIWIMANVFVGDLSLLRHCTDFLDPFARLLGLDGVILLAFILGFPANEIVVPIIIMAYLSTGNIAELSNLASLRELFITNGWTVVTAACTTLFCLLHWPCSTTVWTIRKETGSWKWTLLSMAIPTAVGLAACFVVATAARLAGVG